MPPTSSNQAPENHGGVHPLLGSFANETRALLLRLLAYLCIPVVLVLAAMELWSATQPDLVELVDSTSKIIAAKEAAGTEAPAKQALNGPAGGDRTPAAETASDRAVGQQASPAAATTPASRDPMRRQRLLEPEKSPVAAPSAGSSPGDRSRDSRSRPL